MLDAFLFAGLPYVAILVLVLGAIIRYRRDRFSYSALSSQFIESGQVRWGAPVFHASILLILLGHVLALGFPGLWRMLVASPGVLIAVEIVGIAATVACIAGLAVLLSRRLTHGRLQGVSTPMDFVVLFLLLAQVLLGLSVALGYRWGSAWAAGTLAPYLGSVLLLQPDLALVADMPGLVKAHIACAWLLILIIPFSRLVHMFSVPVLYITRPLQKVVWASSRRFQAMPHLQRNAESRRYFLRAAAGFGIGGALLGLGVADKTLRYFRGPEMDGEQEAELLTKRLDAIEMTAEQRALELERLREPYIHVARMRELTAKKGKYFIDYQMRPALAFLDKEGLPLLISAKCTHLGCTVGSDADSQGRILCPCHISYFDIQTGKPHEGAPAKTPLPHLGFVLRDSSGKVVLTQAPDGTRDGAPDPETLADCSVFIARKFSKEAA